MILAETGLRETAQSAVVTDTTLAPFSAVGQFALQFPSTTASASGVLISDTHVLTVADAFVDNGFGGPPEEIVFAPGQSGDDAPFGSAFGIDVWTPPEFQTFAEDFNYDFAIVELDRPLGAEAVSLSFASTDGVDLTGLDVASASFPNGFDGEMVASMAPVQQVFDNVILADLEAAPGSSGGPVFAEIGGVQSLIGTMIGQGGEGEPNFALRFTDDIVARLETAVDHGLDILRDFGPAEHRSDPALVFDEAFYLASNPDVAAAVESGVFSDAFTHYDRFGRDEGRDPTDWFDSGFYLTANPDVVAAEIDAFTHFLRYGQFEERTTSGTLDDAVAEVFDEAFYLADNPGVAAAVERGTFDSGFDHYQAFGREERRDPTDWFDTSFYLQSNPDVAGAGIDPFAHFLRFGQFEDRIPAPADELSLFG